ncbi:MAG: LysM peptidoglycan-binding domain-containing protein [Prevotella sp.]|nr:LysM peptidoglycan-binding domain-containing protein [Prevotella sp.]
MKKLVITILLSLGIGAPALAQQTEHQVKRGETFASIAAKYSITEAALRKANADKKIAYVGVKLRIPVSKVTSKSVASDTTVPGSKPAVQPFSPTTEYSDNSNSLANFNKGKDYFYNKKWKKAIKAFNEVLSDPLADENTKQQSQQFLVQAQKQQQERKERREAFWSRLSEGLKNLGSSLTETSLAMQGQKTDRSTVIDEEGLNATQTFADKEMQQTVPYNYNGGVNVNQNNVPYYSVSPTPIDDNSTKTCYRCNGTGLVPNYRVERIARQSPNAQRRICNQCGAEHFSTVHETCGLCKGNRINRNSYYNVSPTLSNESSTKTCYRCNGTGLVPNYRVERIARQSPNAQRRICNQCGAEHFSTVHETCGLCKGNRMVR